MKIENYPLSRTDKRLLRNLRRQESCGTSCPTHLFLAFLVVLAVLLLVAWIQTMVWFRPAMIELSARADRQLAEASELLDQAREMSGEVGP